MERNEVVEALRDRARWILEQDDVPPASMLPTAAIYEVGAAILEQLIKLTRATRS